MKVIFLDIDGVMNSQVFYEERYKKRWFENYIKWPIKKFLLKIKIIKPTTSQNYVTPKNWYTFKFRHKDLLEETCSQKWEWLSEWCNENDVKICISSVWKSHFRDENGKRLDWWDKSLTELGFKPGTFVGITKTHRTLRGTEIKEWLDEHPEVEDYAILDDDSDMLEEQFCKFHHVDRWFGLTPNHLYRIKRQFNHKTNYYEKINFSVR